MNYIFLLAFIVFLIAAWYAWRYYRLRREIDEYARQVRELQTNTQVIELQNLSSALASMIAAFDLRHSNMESERARLAKEYEATFLTPYVAAAAGAGEA